MELMDWWRHVLIRKDMVPVREVGIVLMPAGGLVINGIVLNLINNADLKEWGVVVIILGIDEKI